VTAEDFAREHVILYVTPREHSTLFQEVLVPAGVTPARVSEMPLTEAILELVKAGLGITVLARWAVEPAVAAGALVARPLTAKRFRRRWYAAIMRYKRTPEHLEEFARLLVRGPGLLRAPHSPARKSRRATPRARTA
jgi:LysR family transcriptional regulator for metE and metH